MSPKVPPSRPRKKAANPCVDSALLMQAKRLNLNLSQTLEAGLAGSIGRHEREQWLKNNQAALDAYNEHVEKHGVFCDGLRSF